MLSPAPGVPAGASSPGAIGASPDCVVVAAPIGAGFKSGFLIGFMT